jgi:uncharacterized protein (TIGR03083 family)
VITDWIASERRELAVLLDGLSAAQWDTPSLCDGWTVGHVVAHLTMPLRYSTPRFLLGLARAGGRFQRMSDGVARRDVMLPRAQLIAALRDHAENPWKPPGGGYEGALTHDVIHSLDITCPLGIERHFPPEPMKAVLDTVAGPKSRKYFAVDTSGFELRATDLDWSCGSGAPLLGRAQDLALLLTGRSVPRGAFSGEGTIPGTGTVRGAGGVPGAGSAGR